MHTVPLTQPFPNGPWAWDTSKKSHTACVVNELAMKTQHAINMNNTSVVLRQRISEPQALRGVYPKNLTLLFPCPVKPSNLTYTRGCYRQ